MLVLLPKASIFSLIKIYVLLFKFKLIFIVYDFFFLILFTKQYMILLKYDKEENSCFEKFN